MSPFLARYLYALTLLAFVLVRLRFRGGWRPAERAARREDRERALTAAVLGSQAIPALLWLGSRWLDPLDLPLPPAAGWAGLGLSLAGIGLFGWTHAVLGANFSPRLDLRPDHTLVTAGPYRRVRHPMYLSGFLLYLGWFGLTGNPVVGGLPLAVLLVLVRLRLPDEEAMMAERFGAAWTAWAARTGRLFPRLRRRPPSV